MEKIKITATECGEGIKIREYLKRRLGFSTSLISKVKYGGVLLNSSPVHMRAMVREDDIIEIHFPAEMSENIPPIKIPLDIIFEDDWLLAVNKPRNMPVHPSKGNNLPTLANGVMAYMDRNFVFRAVNRLDRDTSGVVVIAKSQLSAARLSKIIRNGQFIKKYHAIVCGVPDIKGRIDAPIEREAEGSIKRIVRPDGKPCVTEYKRLSICNEECSLCEINLITGRTHQIRVHMAHIGHPLKNDFLYGERNGEETYRLHCTEVSFPHPITNQLLKLTAEADFIDINLS